ncbi:5E5 antigen-like [Suricata suricatta]|uniref:5E5 antigen-like n=1 Tax=Suricata suricatta TaxID=37032 RepID=UPI0011557407|nr:5E5 antigen-like [Suricata suricatta]
MGGGQRGLGGWGGSYPRKAPRRTARAGKRCQRHERGGGGEGEPRLGRGGRWRSGARETQALGEGERVRVQEPAGQGAGRRASGAGLDNCPQRDGEMSGQEVTRSQGMPGPNRPGPRARWGPFHPPQEPVFTARRQLLPARPGPAEQRRRDLRPWPPQQRLPPSPSQRRPPASRVSLGSHECCDWLPHARAGRCIGFSDCLSLNSGKKPAGKASPDGNRKYLLEQ